MAMKLKVAYEDGREVEVNVGPRAEVMLEDEFDIAASDAKRNKHVYYLAWAALHLAGPERDTTFDDFMTRIESVDVATAAPVDPTPAAAEGAGSPS